MVVGRDEACPVQIVDSRASRKHVQIRFDETKNTHVAPDMKSANGGRCSMGGCSWPRWAPVTGTRSTVGESKIVYCVQEFPDKENAPESLQAAWTARDARRSSSA